MIKISYDFSRALIFACLSTVFFAILLKNYDNYLIIVIISSVLLFAYLDCKDVLIYHDKLVVKYYFYIIPLLSKKIIFTKDEIDIKLLHVSKAGWLLRMIPKKRLNVISHLFFQLRFSMGSIDSKNNIETIEISLKKAGFNVTTLDGK